MSGDSHKLWGDFDSDDDREYLEHGVAKVTISPPPGASRKIGNGPGNSGTERATGTTSGAGNDSGNGTGKQSQDIRNNEGARYVTPNGAQANDRSRRIGAKPDVPSSRSSSLSVSPRETGSIPIRKLSDKSQSSLSVSPRETSAITRKLSDKNSSTSLSVSPRETSVATRKLSDKSPSSESQDWRATLRNPQPTTPNGVQGNEAGKPVTGSSKESPDWRATQVPTAQNNQSPSLAAQSGPMLPNPILNGPSQASSRVPTSLLGPPAQGGIRPSGPGTVPRGIHIQVSDTPTASPRVSPAPSPHSCPGSMPGPWNPRMVAPVVYPGVSPMMAPMIPPNPPPPYAQAIPIKRADMPVHGGWVNAGSPRLAGSPYGGSPFSGSPFGGSPYGSPRHLGVAGSPRLMGVPQLGPLGAPAGPAGDETDYSQGIPSPRVVIMGCPSPRGDGPERRNYELEALYDMVPRHIAAMLKQQTPTLLANMVTLLLAQPFGLTWQELCVNYIQRYHETPICPVTSSGATMSPNSILSDCCHRHEGLFTQEAGKFRVRADLLQSTIRPAVRKALLRLQEEATKKVCTGCPALLEDGQAADSEDNLCLQCFNKAKVEKVDKEAGGTEDNGPPAAKEGPVQALQPTAAARSMPPDWRDNTVGGDLPTQILAVLPAAGMPFLQLPKAFQQKHGVALKQQMKGKLGEFLETMAEYGLVTIGPRNGPPDTWYVRPLVQASTPAQAQAHVPTDAQLAKKARAEEKKLTVSKSQAEVHI